MTKSARFALNFTLVLALLAFGLFTYLFSGFFLQSIVNTPAIELETFSHQLNKWESHSEGNMPQGVVDNIGLDDWILRSYAKIAGQPVWLYIGYIAGENLSKSKTGLGSHHSPTVCYPLQGWKEVERGYEEIPLGDHPSVRVNKLRVRKGEEERLVLYWFHWGERRVIEEGGLAGLQTKLRWVMQLPSALLGQRRTDKSFVRISAPVVVSPEATLERLVDFVGLAFPEVAKVLVVDAQS